MKVAEIGALLQRRYDTTATLLEACKSRETTKAHASPAALAVGGTVVCVSAELSAADVLKVAHHGSASSTNDDFLAAVKPRFAVISVGARNVYHHPRTEVLQRLAQVRARTHRTDMDGATSFYLDGKAVTSQLVDLH